MAFVVTARKWRPQLFEDVVGQNHISTTLKNAIENNRIGHAYIFAGPRGVGKTTTARILAKRLNCENPNGGEPCNSCNSCNTFLQAQSLDIIEIDGASNRRIDEIRSLRESVKYAPTSGQYKVYIIDEVHMLTNESFNALLKTLEEPPEHTIFIFATTDIHKVPLTIISRCQRFDFRRIELEEIKSLLLKISKSEKIEIDDESLTLIAKKADGALRDAESIFDQVVSFCGSKIDATILKQMLNLIDDEIYFQVSDSILSKNYSECFEITSNIYSNGWNFIDFFNGLLEHFRNISSVVITKDTNFIESSKSLKERYLKYVDEFSEGDLLRILTFLSKAQQELKTIQNQKLKVEVVLTQLIGFEKSSTITELLTRSPELRIENGEKKKDNLDYNKTTFIEQPATPSNKIDSEPQFKNKVQNTKEVNNEFTITKNDNITEPPLSKVDFAAVNKGWDEFKSTITKERFTLGPLLQHCSLSSISNNDLLIDVNHKEDVSILTTASDFLAKRYFELNKAKLKMNFRYNKNIDSGPAQITSNSDDIVNESYKEHPLIKSIISELGGREIK